MCFRRLTRLYTAPRLTDGIEWRWQLLSVAGRAPKQRESREDLQDLDRNKSGKERAAGPPPRRTGCMSARVRTFSQVPKAVRSACGRRWDWALPAGAPAGGTFQSDKRDAFGLTVQVHGLRNISS